MLVLYSLVIFEYAGNAIIMHGLHLDHIVVAEFVEEVFIIDGFQRFVGIKGQKLSKFTQFARVQITSHQVMIHILEHPNILLFLLVDHFITIEHFEKVFH